MKGLYQAADLFEVTVPEFKQLKACRREVKLLKNLWDLITLVQSSFNDWKTTLWSDINVENMELECKKFVKDIRGLDKEMRAWDAFTGMESSVKNMVTSLRAVGELQNPAIRDRHWEQLMQATQVITGCIHVSHMQCTCMDSFLHIASLRGIRVSYAIWREGWIVHKNYIVDFHIHHMPGMMIIFSPCMQVFVDHRRTCSNQSKANCWRL